MDLSAPMSILLGLPQVDLDALTMVIATSPIVLRGEELPIVLRGEGLEARLADWPNTRMAPDVDAVILAWFASHGAVKRNS
jgi:hypothetical protein